MADTKVSALSAATTATDDDLLYLVDDPGGTPASKKITVANFITSIQGTGSGDCAVGNHTHTGVYEPANANIQSHISSTSNPHTVTKTQLGLSAVTNDAQLKIASNLSDLADAATARTNLGVAIGTNVQAYDADLAAVAGLSTTGVVARTGAGTAATRTITGTANRLTVTNGDGVSGNPTLNVDSALTTGSIVAFVPLDSTGLKGALRVDFACTITAVTTIANATGSCVIDIKKSTYSGYPTTTSICASAKPTLSSARKAEDTTLTGWTTSITAGDVLEFTVDSASGLSWASVTLKYSR